MNLTVVGSSINVLWSLLRGFHMKVLLGVVKLLKLRCIVLLNDTEDLTVIAYIYIITELYI